MKATLRKACLVLVSLLAGTATATAEAPAAGAADYSPLERLLHADSERAGRSIAMNAAYTRQLDAFDELREKYPHDVVTAVDKCRFIDTFLYSEVYDLDYERLEADLDACKQDLADSFPRNAEVALYELEGLYGDEFFEAADQYAEDASSFWTVHQVARLYTALADNHSWNDDTEQAGKYALKALYFNPFSDVRLIAARHLADSGDQQEAVEVLLSSFDDENNQEEYRAVQKASLLFELEATDEALLQYDALRSSRDTPLGNLELASQLAQAGNVPLAREEFAAATEYQWLAPEAVAVWFDFELAGGSREHAEAAYQAYRDLGYRADPFARQRIRLSLAYPGAAWQWRDALGVLALIAAMGFCVAVPAVLIGPVHHRGLVRWQTGALHWEHTDWHLAHAWYAMAAWLLGELVLSVIFFGDVPGFVATAGAPFTEAALSESNARFFLWHTVFITLYVLPLLPAGGALRNFGFGTWSVGKAVGVAFAGFLILRVAASLLARVFPELAPGSSESFTVEALKSFLEHYGPWMFFLVVAVVVPAIEEIVFRGVLLNAFAKHLSFGAANMAQAGLFAAVHGSLRLLPFYILFGVLAGLYSRRSEGLAVATGMHALNNALVALALIAGLA